MRTKCATSPAAFTSTKPRSRRVRHQRRQPVAQQAWARQNEISIKLLSDFDKKVTRAYDLVLPGIAGIGDTAARAAVVIDKSGKIVHIEQTPRPEDLPDFEAIKAALGAAK